MDAIRKALAIVLDIASQQIDSLDDETMNALTQLLNQANKRILQLREEEKPIGVQFAEDEQEDITNGIPPVGPISPPGQPPTGGPVPPLDPAPHASSNVNALKYDPIKKQLYIKFMGKDTADSGPTYSYSGVEKNIFDVILRGGIAPLTSGKNKYHEWFRGITPSHGASVNALLVKGNYPYERIR